MRSRDEKVVIGPQHIEARSNSILVSYSVEGARFPDRLWFEVDMEDEAFIDRSLNSALVALLIPTMKTGVRIELRGNVSFRLLLSCQTEVQAILREMFNLEKIDIDCMGSVMTTATDSTMSATGFSGGVDSYSIIKDYYFTDTLAEESKLGYLVFNNVGANGRTDERPLFERRCQGAKDAAKRIGLPLIVVDSNLDDFYAQHETLYFAKTHTFRNTAVAHLLSGKIGIYRYASAFPFRECMVREANTIGYADPVILPFLSSEKLDMQPNGSQYTRSQKIRSIVDNPLVKRNLYVCVDHNTNRNCSRCHKCMRTLLVIDMLGKLEDFRHCFDTNVYRQYKAAYLVEALVKNDSFSRDIQSLFVTAGWSLTLKDALVIKARRCKTAAKNTIKQMFPAIIRWRA